MTIKLTISTDDGKVFQLEVDANEVIENLKALVEVESGIPLAEQALLYNGRELTSNQQQLDKAGVKDNELIFVTRKANINLAPQNLSPLQKAQEFQNYIRNDPSLMQQLLNNDPQLASAVLSDDLTSLSNLLTQRENLKRQREAEELRKIQMYNADPLNPEYQKAIAEEIRMSNINENMEQAIEHMPESFARVIMLYIDITVNNTPVKAFVDSGAQQTIMSAACAERCGIMRLIDTRYKGIAKGVGTARIIGRVHMAPLKIGKSYFPCSFTILEEGIDFLLGLDMLRRHQCAIDLKDGVLRIGEESVSFLSEKDIPRSELFDGEEPNSPSTSTTAPKVSTPIISNTPPSKPSTAPPSKASNTPAPLAIPNLGNLIPNITVPNQARPPAPQQNRAPSFPEATITQLMGLGFSRDEVINALRMASGNADLAASVLFGGGM